MKYSKRLRNFSEFIESLDSENAGKNSAFDSIGRMRIKTRIRFLTNFMVMNIKKDPRLCGDDIRAS